jgi:MFS transporter, ACS family, D-galactonate transporter
VRCPALSDADRYRTQRCVSSSATGEAGGLYGPIPAMRGTRNKIGRLLAFGGNIGGMAIPIVIGAIVQFTGSRFLELLCFAAMEVGRLICSRGLAYQKNIPV